jgi:hypothetical protein
MKKILTHFLIIFSISANAQKEIPAHQYSDSTEIGKPNGSPVNKQIGAAGGIIVSDDKRIELIFPAGALTAMTTISIQPTINHLANGVGAAYQFEPSGTQFKKPVELIFHYTEEEAKACPPELMNFGLQNHLGKWDFFEHTEWDSIGGRLKGFIFHFSGFTALKDLMMRPLKKKIAVNERDGIWVLDKGVIVESGEFAGDMDVAILSTNKIKWYVNGVNNGELGGNEKEGTAKTSFLINQGTKEKPVYSLSGEYIAPAAVPLQNPVIIKLAVKYFSKKDKKYKWGSCECAILIYDAYRVKVEYYFTGREGFGSEMIDSATFVVKIDKPDIIIEEIKNYPPRSIKEGSRIGIDEKILLDGAPGPVHITKELTRHSEISKGSPPQVFLDFQPSDPIYYSLFYYIRKMRITTETVKHTGIALPQSFSFVADGKMNKIKQGGNKEIVITIRPGIR